MPTYCQRPQGATCKGSFTTLSENVKWLGGFEILWTLPAVRCCMLLRLFSRFACVVHRKVIQILLCAGLWAKGATVDGRREQKKKASLEHLRKLEACEVNPFFS